MIDVPPQPFLPWKVSISLLHSVAATTAVLRLYHRRRTCRLWWDDYAAVVPAFTECLNAVLIWVRLRIFSDAQDVHLRSMKVHLGIVNAELVATTIWWSRLSMSLAIVRITPEWSRFRKVSCFATVAFIFGWVALLISFSAICTLRTSWQYGNADILVCGPAYMAAIASIVLDIIADIYLVAVPLYRLWHLRLPPAQRRLVRLVFSTSILTLLAAIMVTVTSYGKIITGPGSILVWLMTVQIEEAISVIANNLTVLIAWGYKAFRDDIDVDAESNTFIKPHWTSTDSSNLPSINTAHMNTSIKANCNESTTDSQPESA